MKYEPTPQEYAAVYARKSTLADNNSIQAQTSLAMDVLEKKGLLLYKVFSDIETATKYEPIHRVGFKELMHDAIEGKFHTLVVFRRDRLARKASHLIEIKKFFKKCKIRIIYSNEGEFQPDDSYISNFIENIIMAVDELEPKILSERIESGKLKKRERGEYCSGKYIPFGYAHNPLEGNIRYECITEEIELVKKVFNEFINDSSKSENMKKLSKEILEFRIKKNKKLYDETKDEKYLKTNPLSIMTTIKTPIYANLQFKNKELDITSEDVFDIVDVTNPIVNKKLFHECTNVEKAIDADIWYRCIEKWKTSNLKRAGVGQKAPTLLFKNLLYCKSCGGKIWFTDNDFKCKTGCFTIPKDDAINKMLFILLVELVGDEHFTRLVDDKIELLKKYISKKEETLAKKAKQIRNKIVRMVTSSKSSDNALDKFFKTEHAINEELSRIKMKRMELIYLKANIKSLITSPKIITDLKEKQDYLQIMLQNLIERVLIDGSKKQLRTTIIYKE